MRAVCEFTGKWSLCDVMLPVKAYFIMSSLTTSSFTSSSSKTSSPKTSSETIEGSRGSVGLGVGTGVGLPVGLAVGGGGFYITMQSNDAKAYEIKYQTFRASRGLC